MPKMLFASNSIAHFDGSQISGDAWTYDANRVPYGIKTPLSTVCSSPRIPAASGDETWFHFKAGAETWWVHNNEPIAQIVDENGLRIFQLTYQNNGTGYTMYLEADGQTQSVTRALPMLDASLRTYDIQLDLNSVNVTGRVYVNKMLIGTVTFSVSSHENPAFLWLGGATGTGGIGEIQYSEIIVAEGDTRNARLDLLRPISVGAHTDWNGSVSALSDDDPTTGMTTISANQEQTTNLDAYTGADNISNVVQVTTSVRGINSPTQLQHMLRASTVDYFSSNFTIPQAEEIQVTDWNENPATSLPWASADLTGMEFGFKSIA